MDTSDNKQVIEAFYRAGDTGDVEGMLALLADDLRWTNIGSTRYSGTFEGKSNVVEGLFAPLFGQLKNGIAAKVDNVVAEGEFVVVQLRGEGETLAGRAYNNTYCHVFRVRDGLIREVTEYFDTALVDAVFD